MAETKKKKNSGTITADEVKKEPTRVKRPKLPIAGPHRVEVAVAIWLDVEAKDKDAAIELALPQVVQKLDNEVLEYKVRGTAARRKPPQK